MSTVHKVMQLWRPGQYIKPHDAGPRIGHLFGAGQQGGVYLFDKAHQASAFQGGAYDTPLSAAEQFIGSFYDLSGNANHYSQPTSTARGKWSVRVNLLLNSKLEGGGSSPPGWLPITSGTSAPAGVTFDGHVIYEQSAVNERPFLPFMFPVSSGVNCVLKFTVQEVYGLSVNQLIGYSAGTSPVYKLNGAVVGGSTIATPGEYELVFTTNTTGNIQARYGIGVNGGISGAIKFHSPSLTFAGQSYLPYQRVNTAADYDTAGFPPYLLPDGADDYYTSASGGGSTTGLFICAAIAPMAAGAKQVIWSDASGNTGYELCINASNQVEFSAGTGSARVSCVSAALSFGAPKVITAQHDGTNLTVRVDGVATTAACGAASAGTAGTTLLRANGAASGYAKVQINGLVQRHGAQPSAEQLTFAERYMANLQGRTL